MSTNIEAAAAAIRTKWQEADQHGSLMPWTNYGHAALDAIDPRLADLTPDDVTAILDFVIASVERPDWRERFAAIPAHAWEVLSR